MRSVPALSVLALLSATAAIADPAPGTIMKATPPPQEQQRPSPEVVCLHSYQVKVARIGQMASAMKLTDVQKPLFEAWRNVRIEVDKGWPCPLPPVGLGVPTPKRLASEIGVLKYELEALQKEEPAARALYDALAPEQRAIFDNPSAMNPHPPAAANPPAAPESH